MTDSAPVSGSRTPESGIAPGIASGIASGIAPSIAPSIADAWLIVRDGLRRDLGARSFDNWLSRVRSAA
jgi:hypothetical protein